MQLGAYSARDRRIGAEGTKKKEKKKRKIRIKKEKKLVAPNGAVVGKINYR